MLGKLKALLQSRRFYVALLGVVVVVLQDALGLTLEEAKAITAVLMAWIVGDSINKT